MQIYSIRLLKPVKMENGNDAYVAYVVARSFNEAYDACEACLKDNKILEIKRVNTTELIVGKGIKYKD